MWGYIEVNGPLVTKALAMPENEAVWSKVMEPGFRGSLLISEEGIVTIKPDPKKPVKKTGMTWAEIEEFLESMRQGFYLGCRVDPHSPQVGEFVESMLYYLDKEKSK